MSRCNAPENFFLWYGVAHGRAQEPTPGSAVKFWGKSVRKNRPLVPRSNIAGSWTRGGGGGGTSVPNRWSFCAAALPFFVILTIGGVHAIN